MKVKVDIDITPKGVRRLFGLPDVEVFQRQLMDDIRQRMSAGVEGYDPLKLFQPYLAGTLASGDYFQKLMASLPASSSKPDGNRST
ncbi:MAG: DUF6489 family protein [Thermochromatium sp.]